MMNLRYIFALILCSVILFCSCSYEDDGFSSGSPEPTTDDSAADAGELTSAEGDGSGGSNGQNQEPQPKEGQITAGEWSDLENWDFWNELLIKEETHDYPGIWDFHTDNRLSYVITNNLLEPLPGVIVKLKNNDNDQWQTVTDNKGRIELWINPWQQGSNVELNGYELEVDGITSQVSVRAFDGNADTIQIESSTVINQAEIAFVVDATGSMSDEITYLKDDLEDIIQKVGAKQTNTTIRTASVFYRDETDAYVTRTSPFSTDLSTTIDFIQVQNADGGGDFPEAVHSALTASMTELSWTTNAKTKLMFLLLDAPPHKERSVITQLQKEVKAAAFLGIKIIPIVASGIDKETEFLMRSIAIITNGTYVFITNDSGIGEDHIEASVGQYTVEKLNSLLERLINENIE